MSALILVAVVLEASGCRCRCADDGSLAGSAKTEPDLHLRMPDASPPDSLPPSSALRIHKDRGPEDAAKPPPRYPRNAPILDKDKGRQAVAAYSRFHARFCRSLNRSGTAARQEMLKRVGIDENAYVEDLCWHAAQYFHPFASGSFVRRGADEVLLLVPNGSLRQTLALMRRGKKGYRLVRHMLSGEGFSARVRITAPGAQDILMLCEDRGRMGVYESTCGFFGRGYFGWRRLRWLPPLRKIGDPPEPDPQSPPGYTGDDEFELDFEEGCGPRSSVSLGKITLQDNRLLVRLNVYKYLREQKGPSDYLCSKVTIRSSKRVIVVYRFTGSRFKRVTPVPR